jgi:hypothetical protein
MEYYLSLQWMLLSIFKDIYSVKTLNGNIFGTFIQIYIYIFFVHIHALFTVALK